MNYTPLDYMKLTLGFLQIFFLFGGVLLNNDWWLISSAACFLIRRSLPEY